MLLFLSSVVYSVKDIAQGHDGVIIFMIIVVVLFFVLMESGNIATQLGSAAANYTSARTPGVNPGAGAGGNPSTVTTGSQSGGLSQVISKAGAVANAAAAAATNTETPSTSTTSSVG